MIGLDTARLSDRVRSGFSTLESALAAEQITPASVVAEHAAVQAEATPIHTARGQIHTMLRAAREIGEGALDPTQRKLAQEALAAAEALSSGTTSLVALSDAYAKSGQLCETLLRTVGLLERQAKGYQSAYTWNQSSIMYSSGQSWELAGKITELLRYAEALPTTRLGAALLRHRDELTSLRKDAAELGFAEAFNRSLLGLVPSRAGADAAKWSASSTWLFGLLAGVAEVVDDATLLDLSRRLVQVSTALVVAHGKSPSELALAKVFALPATHARLQAALTAVAATPHKVDDPAGLFGSESELMEAARLEGGMQSREAPPRPTISSEQIAATARALAEALYSS